MATAGLVERSEVVLRERLAAVRAADSGAEVAELVDELRGVLAAAEVLRVAVAERVDATRAFDPSGARSVPVFLAWRWGLPTHAVRGACRAGRALRDMPLVAEAFDAGLVSVDHVRVLAAARDTAPEAFTEAEAMLLGYATDYGFTDFERLVRYWRQVADPDGSLAEAERRFLRREVTAVTGPDGMTVLRGQLDAVSAGSWLAELERIEQELFDADWTAARVVLGDAVTLESLGRTAGQRRADALVEMARRSSMVDATASRRHAPRPTVSYLVGADTLRWLCERDDGTILDPHELLRVLRDADLERVVFAGPSRVLDVGERQRLFTGATRRAVELRDRTCTHPTCTVPAKACEIDHVVPVAQGGGTTQGNGRCLCPFHHRWRHAQE